MFCAMEKSKNINKLYRLTSVNGRMFFLTVNVGRIPIEVNKVGVFWTYFDGDSDGDSLGEGHSHGVGEGVGDGINNYVFQPLEAIESK